jgi:hypothetical protein
MRDNDNIIPIPPEFAALGIAEGESVVISRAQHKALMAAAKAMQWNPIETAPKAGRFLAWWRSPKMKNPEVLEWDENGKLLWTDCGTAVHELETAFKYWCPITEPESVR